MPRRNSPWFSGTASTPRQAMRRRSAREIRWWGLSTRTNGHSTAVASTKRNSASTSGGNSTSARFATRNVPLAMITFTASAGSSSDGPGRGGTRRPRTILAAAVAVYLALHAWNSTLRFDSFHANAWDLGFVSQALWCTARGAGFLHSDMARGGSYLGEHFSPALSLGAVAYAFTDSIRGLFVLQALVLGAG